MWLVAKIKNNYSDIFKKEILKKNLNIEFYEPKYKVDNISNNKKIKRDRKNLLNNYIFCYYSNFSKNLIETLKFSKGLEYFLTGQELYQKDIIAFINYCKSFEDEQNIITNNFFKNLIEKKGKFSSGPLKNIIFDLIEKKKNKLIIKFGQYIATVDDNKAAYVPA